MAWYLPDWPTRKALTVTSRKVTADIAGFPMMVVRTNDADLFSAQRNGQDIVFADQAGNKLAHELLDYFCGVVKESGWVWFTRPSAVRYSGTNDRTYLSYQQNSGAITIIQYDHDTHSWSMPFDLHAAGDTANLMVNEDHGPASILVRAADKKLMVWYAGHSGPDLFQRVSTHAEDASAWSMETNLAPQLALSGYSYPNPVQFSDGTIWLLFRSHPGRLPTKWFYSSSSDQGTTWAAPVEFFRTDTYGYVQVIQGGDVLHFCANPDHPRYNTANPTYSFKYTQRTDMWAAHDGATLSLPISSSNVPTVVYDGLDGRSWIWDIAVGADGNPRILYVRIDVNDTRHRMYWARWTGAAHGWRSHLIVDTGTHIGSFNPNDVNYQDPWYSGGACFDHSNPNNVYVSRRVSSVHEIYHYVTWDDGATWTAAALTRGSKRRNFRPIVPRHSRAEARLFWRQGAMADYTRHLTGITSYPLLPRINYLAARVKTDLRSDADTKIYMYWGNQASAPQENRIAVWAPADHLVWHGREAYDVSATKADDSTRHANNGTKSAVNRPHEAAGRAFRGHHFDGTDYVNFGGVDMAGLTGLTILVGVKYNRLPARTRAHVPPRPGFHPRALLRGMQRLLLDRFAHAWRRLRAVLWPEQSTGQTLLSNWSTGTAGFMLRIRPTTSARKLEILVRTNTAIGGMSSHRIFENTWTMTGLTYDMTDGLLAWKDGIGARVAAAAGALHPNASDNLFAGAHREPSAATECLTGDMEAVLISFEKKSSAYIKAWSDTWSDSNTFYSAGAMETRRCEVPKNGCGRVGFD